MYKYLENIPADRTIVIRTCTDRGGHKYTYPFIGEHAISKYMKRVLTDNHIPWDNGCVVPLSFFEKYDLIECFSDPSDPEDEEYVTSNLWYTCRENMELLPRE